MNRHERRRAQAAARAFDKRVERDRVESRRSPRPAMLGIVQKRIEQIMTTDGDHCSLCRARFQHNHRSYGGITSDGVVALMSSCCASKLDVTLTSGLYTSRPYAELQRTGPIKELSPEQIEEAITAYQQYFAATDDVVDSIARRAGVPAEKMRLHHDDDATSWKADDREWFERNPTRSHRLRPVFPGEPIGRGNETVPPGHDQQVVVRQVEPGLRVRKGFYRNLEIDDFPNDEALLHALFDLLVKRDEGRASVNEIVELARKYERCGAVS